MRYYGASDIGLVRKMNQDSYLIATNEKGDVFAIVCDGIGGGKSGDIASEMMTRYFGELFAKQKGFASQEEVENWLGSNLEKANDYLFTQSTTDKSLEGMGTTLVGALFCSQGIYVVNVGDSRAYVIQDNNEMKQITIDHNLAEDLFQKGEINQEDVAVHPKRNVLTNALGVVGSLKVDIFPLSKEIKRVLLCSDGLHGYVKEEEIKKLLTDSTSVQETVKKLIESANRAGGYDNITVIVVELTGGKE